MNQPETSPSPRTRRRWLYAVPVLLMLPVTVLGWIVAQDYLREQRIEEFVRTTSIDNNPWGIERGMSKQDAESRFPEIDGYLAVVIYSLGYDSYRIKWQGDYYIMTVFYDTRNYALQKPLVELRVSHLGRVKPDWIIRLQSWIGIETIP